MRRARLSLCRQTSISRKLPDANGDQLIMFQHPLINLRHLKTFLLEQIGDADQMPVYLDMPPLYTVNEKGGRQVLL